MDFQRAFGQVLREARLGASLTQEQLAEASGLHYNTISQVERGVLGLSVMSLKALCDAMGCEPWQVLLETKFKAAEQPIT